MTGYLLLYFWKSYSFITTMSTWLEKFTELSLFSSGLIFAYFVFIFPFGAFLRFKRDALDSPLDLWVHDETEASFHIKSNY